ncbi:MAG TPA: DegV family protein [Firmicutes bacterium]|nr:DegV family protein [Bacillota bacterium]
MPRIHVVTDSGSDLPDSIRSQYNIHLVPLSIQFGEEIYLDTVELSAEQFYQRLGESSALPSTCQPSPADFVKCYEQISEPGDHIISVHLSSRLSGTYQSAVLASTMVENRNIHIIDTKSASIGIGMVAMAISEAVQNGASVEDALALGERVMEDLQVYFVVDTLEYLRRNGRIGAASAMVGSLLNIKPVLTLANGIVTPFDKVRGKARALKRIYDLLGDYVQTHQGRKIRIGLVHSNCADEALQFADKIKSEFAIEDFTIGLIGPTIGVHVGPGTIALLWHPI